MISTKTTLGQEYEQLFKARKEFYQLLYSLLSEPLTIEKLQTIKKEYNIEGLYGFSGGDLLNEFFNSRDLEIALKQAREDYFRLFIGPDSLLAPPWESVYRGKDKCLFDFPTFEVRELYSHYNLALQTIPNQHDEADDHICYELLFMTNLIERSLLEVVDLYEFKELISGQKAMLVEHLSKWVPQFSEDIRKNAKSSLFIAVALLLEEFIKYDNDVIAEMLNDVIQ